jgi:hypothetical protein
LTWAFCSSSASPYFGEYVFNDGLSAILTCGTTRFTINATTALPSPIKVSATTTTRPSQPTQTQGNKSASSAGLGTGATVGLVVGIISGIVTFVAGAFAILRCLNRNTKSGRESRKTPIDVHFNERVVFVNCPIQVAGTGDQGSATRLLSPSSGRMLRRSSVHTLN